MAATETIRVIFQGVDKLSGEAKKASGSLSDIGKSAGIAVAAIGGFALAAQQVFQITKEGAQFIRLQDSARAMAGQFGQSMTSIVNAMREASNATVDDMTLMSAAARAMQLGVATTPQQFEDLTKASIALGRAMGRGPAEAIDDIVTGIGRMSPLILDNLGIMTKGGGVFEDYARSVGKSADQLSDAEKKQALLNITLESANPLLDANGNLALDAASKYEQFEVKLENVTNLLKSMGATYIIDNVNATERLNEQLRMTGEFGQVGFFEWRKRWWEMYDAIQLSETAIRTVTRRSGDDLIPTLNAAATSGANAAASVGAIGTAASMTSDEIKKLSENQSLQQAATILATGGTQAQADAYMAQYHALRKLNKEIERYANLLQFQVAPGDRAALNTAPAKDQSLEAQLRGFAQ